MLLIGLPEFGHIINHDQERREGPIRIRGVVVVQRVVGLCTLLAFVYRVPDHAHQAFYPLFFVRIYDAADVR